MAGLIRDNLTEEILTELSWIMTAIDQISQKTGIETYETTLIKYRVQPEEEQTIDKFFVFNYNKLNTLQINDIQENLKEIFFELTGKEWTLSDEVVKKILQFKNELLKSK